MSDQRGTPSDLTARIASLSPEKRRLLRRLLENRDGPKEKSNGNEGSRSSRETTIGREAIVAGDRKETAKKLYRLVNENLNATGFAKYSLFLNFGYLADGSPEHAARELPAHLLNRNSVKLVLELVGEVDLEGLTTLDVGCGRGGTVSVLREYFRPASSFGLDLCREAIAFCRRTHTYPRTFFVQGDAERLPFPDGFADVVTNVESSHSYPSRQSFYLQVARVLRPGGLFLYTDVFPRAELEETMGSLGKAGLVLEHDRDITRNVLLSCDDAARTHERSFVGDNDADVMGEFLGRPGSRVYANMLDGLSTYRIMRFCKPDPSAVPLG